jgi:uncharacterized protein YdhG (YjbR/CyaY superfamily)
MKKEEKIIPENIDAYIAEYPEDIRKKLTEMREIICSAIPETTEKISWGMPTFMLKGKLLVQFGAHKAHIGFYPMPEVIEVFQSKLTDYTTTKGGIQFPYKNPLPVDLINEIVKFREEDVLKKLRK